MCLCVFCIPGATLTPSDCDDQLKIYTLWLPLTGYVFFLFFSHILLLHFDYPLCMSLSIKCGNAYRPTDCVFHPATNLNVKLLLKSLWTYILLFSRHAKQCIQFPHSISHFHTYIYILYNVPLTYCAQGFRSTFGHPKS